MCDVRWKENMTKECLQGNQKWPIFMQESVLVLQYLDLTGFIRVTVQVQYGYYLSLLIS